MIQNTQPRKTRFGVFPKLLTVLVVVSVLPLLIVWFLNYQTTMQQATQTAHERLEAVSESLVAQVNYWMEMNTRMLRENAAAPAIRSMDPERQRPVLWVIEQEYPRIHSVLVIGPDGNAISRSDDKPLQNYSDRTYVQQVLAGEPLGQQVLIGKTTGLPGLALAVPIRGDDEAVKGILVSSMATAVLSASVTNVGIGETGYAFLLDAKGRVIARQSMQDSNFLEDFSEHPAFLAFNRDGKSSLAYRDDERDRSVIAYMKSTADGWTLVTQQDYDEAFSAIAATNRNAIVMLVATLSVVLVVAYGVSRRVSQPIERLTRIANEASLANFSAVEGNMSEKDRSDEIGELARSVERLAVSLRVAMGRLQKKPQ